MHQFCTAATQIRWRRFASAVFALWTSVVFSIARASSLKKEVMSTKSTLSYGQKIKS